VIYNTKQLLRGCALAFGIASLTSSTQASITNYVLSLVNSALLNARVDALVAQKDQWRYVKDLFDTALEDNKTTTNKLGTVLQKHAVGLSGTVGILGPVLAISLAAPEGFFEGVIQRCGQASKLLMRGSGITPDAPLLCREDGFDANVRRSSALIFGLAPLASFFITYYCCKVIGAALERKPAVCMRLLTAIASEWDAKHALLVPPVLHPAFARLAYEFKRHGTLDTTITPVHARMIVERVLAFAYLLEPLYPA